jgi:catechol 2,3-dioxygenase-like lactoylglutathione lyase family enzyme
VASRLTHIGLCIAEPERSLHFYEELLGFRRLSELEVKGQPGATLLRLPDVSLRAIYLERDGVCIELLHYSVPGHEGDGSPRPMNRLGLTHLSLRVDDMNALLRELEAAGVTVLHETRVDNPELGAKAIMLTDPDGTLVELVELHEA